MGFNFTCRGSACFVGDTFYPILEFLGAPFPPPKGVGSPRWGLGGGGRLQGEKIPRNHWNHVESDTFRSSPPPEKERANGGFEENSLPNPIFWNAGITYSKRCCWDLVEIASHPIFWFVHFFPFFDISLKFLRDLRTNRTFFPTNLSGFFFSPTSFFEALQT